MHELYQEIYTCHPVHSGNWVHEENYVTVHSPISLQWSITSCVSIAVLSNFMVAYSKLDERTLVALWTKVFLCLNVDIWQRILCQTFELFEWNFFSLHLLHNQTPYTNDFKHLNYLHISCHLNWLIESSTFRIIENERKTKRKKRTNFEDIEDIPPNVFFLNHKNKNQNLEIKIFFA